MDDRGTDGRHGLSWHPPSHSIPLNPPSVRFTPCTIYPSHLPFASVRHSHRPPLAPLIHIGQMEIDTSVLAPAFSRCPPSHSLPSFTWTGGGLGPSPSLLHPYPYPTFPFYNNDRQWRGHPKQYQRQHQHRGRQQQQRRQEVLCDRGGGGQACS